MTRSTSPNDSAAFRRRGNAHLQDGELAEAVECYRKAVAADSADANAHVSLGFALRELQQFADAQGALDQAIALDPNAADAHYLLGTLATARNAPDEAIGHFRRALEVKPDLEPAYRDLYPLLVRTGQVREAQEVIARAITLWPQAVDLQCHLANLLSQQEEYAAAVDCYRKALAISADVPGVHNDLGCALEKLGRLDEAVASYNEALALRPGYADALVNLGNVGVLQGNLDDARSFYERAIAADPKRPAAHSGLGSVLARLGKTAEALECYREGVRLDPARSASHIVAALSGANPEHPPAQYIERLFDGFAGNFDIQLVQMLKYDVPRLLVDAVEQIGKPRPGQWNILDLGCGTGLVGAAVAPYARRLVGVDLSSKMLAKAAERNIYHRLEKLDLLTASQGESASSYDLVLAADVFVYLGKLDDLMAEAKRLLRPGGLIGFSIEDIETLPEAQADQVELPEYQLKRTVRYGHSARYLQRLALDNGFDICHMDAVNVRLEGGKPVQGHIAVWARSGA